MCAVLMSTARGLKPRRSIGFRIAPGSFLTKQTEKPQDEVAGLFGLSGDVTGCIDAPTSSSETWTLSPIPNPEQTCV
jgi:CheY-specific phosphatase CheX